MPSAMWTQQKSRLTRGIRHAAALALISGGAATAQPVPPPMTAVEQAEWPMIGRVNVAGIGARAMCTGTLVAPDLVLTAAHCLRQPGNGTLPEASDVTFVAGWRQGDYITAVQGAALLLHPDLGGRPPAGVARATLAADVALIRLSAAIPPGQVPPLPPSALDLTHGALQMIGYRGDRPHIPTAVTGCIVVAQDAALFGLTCAAVPGVSGGPVLSRTKAGWVVVGVVSAGVRSGRIQTVAVRTPPQLVSDLIPDPAGRETGAAAQRN